MYSRFVDNGKLTVLMSAPRENGFPLKCKMSTRNKLDFQLLSALQKSALLKVPNHKLKKKQIIMKKDNVEV